MFVKKTQSENVTFNEFGEKDIQLHESKQLVLEENEFADLLIFLRSYVKAWAFVKKSEDPFAAKFLDLYQEMEEMAKEFR